MASNPSVHPLLLERLLPVIRRLQWRRAWFAAAITLLVGIAVVALWFVISRQLGLQNGRVWMYLAATMVLLAPFVGLIAALSTASIHTVVQRIEQQFPDLDATLMTAVDQRPLPGTRRLNFLQEDVVRRAVYHSYEKRWSNAVPFWKLVSGPVIASAALVLFAATTWWLYQLPVADSPASPIDFEQVAVIDNQDFTVTVEPGDAEVEKGTGLLVLARFANGAIPPQASLIVKKGDEQQTIEMKKSLDDPVFGARIPAIDSELKYEVQFAEDRSDEFDVSVFEYPQLIRGDAQLSYPEYTRMENREMQDVRRVSAVQGTEASLTFHLNKPVETAILVETGEEVEPIQLQQSSENPNAWTANVPMMDIGTRKFQLQLVDAQQRKNKDNPRFTIRTLENKLPDLKLVKPNRDAQVSAVQEMLLQASAWDDFGMQQVGLSYSIGDKVDEPIVLAESVPAKKKQTVEQLLELESLNAEPDQLLSFYFWAEDFGPDGQLRRVASDMYFAEVRHFEEIFRQGQVQPGGQSPSQDQQSQSGQGGNQANQQLAQLQKQIINATWKVIRRETGNTVSNEFQSDIQLLVESQTQAIEMVAAAAERAQDSETRTQAGEAQRHMRNAVNELEAAVAQVSAAPLKSALKDEQAAYQALLKLRGRESNVTRQSQPASASAQGAPQNSARQQQLEQLNMREQENRYEQEQTAVDESTEEQREVRQILSRLRELARRQNDLNQQIKELQSALEQAETPEEEEELERRLKRLREEQQQILRDAEDLQDRMEQPQNQRQMSEQSEQLNQARENIRQSSEALEQGEVSRAAAEGTRAERELKDLRDEFQKRSSGQFNDRMREMRNRAQQIENKQDQIAQELNQLDDPSESSNSLSEIDQRGDLENRLAEQAQAVNDLRESMKQTIEESEEYEPLLAEELYDTYRESEQDRPDRALESARRSLENGFAQDAQREERRANRGIKQLREGIETAAESVLGDETESLRVARDRLRRLSSELDGEIQRNDPSEESDSNATGEGQPQDSDNPSAENQESNPSPGRGESPPQPQPGGGQSPAENAQQQPNENPPAGNPSGQPAGEQSRSQPGDGQPEGEQQNQSQSGQQRGQSSEGQGGQPNEETSDRQQQSGEQNPNQPPNRNGNPRESAGNREQDREQRMRDLRELFDLNPNRPNQGQAGEQRNTGGNPNMNDRDLAPLTGEDFLDWANRLRDVEEMIADPDLRAEAARIRDRAKEVRRDLKRHSKDPNWDLVRMNIAQPLAELQQRVTEELMRRSAPKNRVPLDRDPVPPRFEEAVRRYYEQLGSGQ